jgi:hypothetical protein
LTETDNRKREVEDLKRRGKWDYVRRQILSALDDRTSPAKKDSKADEGKSAGLVLLERLKEANESFSEHNRRQSLRTAVGLDSCPLFHLYHSFGSLEGKEELHRNFNRTIVCVPIPKTEDGNPARHVKEVLPDHVLCIDIPKGLKALLSQSQIDHLTFVSDILYLASLNRLRSLNR